MGQDLTQAQPAWRQTKRVTHQRSKWAIVFAFLLLALWSLKPDTGTWFPLRLDNPSEDAAADWFDWDKIEPKPYLDYHDCFGDWSEGGFQCARLELPMDYWNGTTDATTSIAVIKKPAAVKVTHPQYGGPILFNPGGPGGSGVGLVLGAGDVFRQIIEPDSKDSKYFDYIGFDPRGVGWSSPTIQCLNDSLVAQAWAMRDLEQGVISASDAAFGRLWSIGHARMSSCSLPREDGEPDIRMYATTASVARDMVEIIERHGEWREKEAERLLSGDHNCARRSQEKVVVPDSLKHKHGKEKINYWGFSYGTYLGNTFAAMFPERIHRLIVDGVVDAYDYKKSLWGDNLVDTEKDLELFYYHCARIGYPLCALANTTGVTTEEGVKDRTYAILQSLYHNPLPVIDARSPEVITYSDVKYLLFGVLYSPIQGFPILAKLLANIESGNGGEFGDYIRALHTIYCPAEEEESAHSGSALRSHSANSLAILEMDTTVAIACTDGDDQSWLTREDFREHVGNLTKISPAIGDIWALLRMQCVHYNIRPNHRFEGPWVANTSHPILEIGNTADPVTPGRYAKKMAKGFTGAVALIQDSGGHCSLAAPSKCTQNYVRQYFQTGELPPEDTVCKADYVPFGPAPGDLNAVDVETEILMAQQATIARALYGAGGGHLGFRPNPWMQNLL